MTRKLIFSGLPLLSAGFDAGRTFAWYVQRRLHRA
jgi:hypothetical protein